VPAQLASAILRSLVHFSREYGVVGPRGWPGYRDAFDESQQLLLHGLLVFRQDKAILHELPHDDGNILLEVQLECDLEVPKGGRYGSSVIATD